MEIDKNFTSWISSEIAVQKLRGDINYAALN